MNIRPVVEIKLLLRFTIATITITPLHLHLWWNVSRQQAYNWGWCVRITACSSCSPW